MRLAVFDLDGTLADTSGDLIDAANAALSEAGFGAPLEAGRDRAVAFAGGRALLRAGLERVAGAADERAVEAGYPRLLVQYAARIDAKTRLYPGVEAALDDLTGAGWGLAVCTNKPIALAETLLGRLGLRERLRAVLGADSRPYRKPDPRHLWETIREAQGTPGRSVLVGDTITDRRAAAAAGVPCVLVTFGPEGRGVAALEPEALLDGYADLGRVLGGLLP